MNKHVTSLLLLFSVGTGAAVAHHNSQPLYDFSQSVTVEAEVVRLELVNPHMRLFVNVAGPDGEQQEWVIDGPGRLSLARHGWTPDTFIPGETITVIGNLATGGRSAIWFDEIIAADGTKYLEPAYANELAIEAQRRSR